MGWIDTSPTQQPHNPHYPSGQLPQPRVGHSSPIPLPINDKRPIHNHHDMIGKDASLVVNIPVEKSLHPLIGRSPTIPWVLFAETGDGDSCVSVKIQSRCFSCHLVGVIVTKSDIAFVGSNSILGTILPTLNLIPMYKDYLPKLRCLSLRHHF